MIFDQFNTLGWKFMKDNNELEIRRNILMKLG